MGGEVGGVAVIYAKPLQLLKRLDRKPQGVPREDARRVGCETGKDVGGDAPADALLSHGFAIEHRGVLFITDTGRRRLADA